MEQGGGYGSCSRKIRGEAFENQAERDTRQCKQFHPIHNRMAAKSVPQYCKQDRDLFSFSICHDITHIKRAVMKLDPALLALPKSMGAMLSVGKKSLTGM
jgi:hypothetical protein